MGLVVLDRKGLKELGTKGLNYKQVVGKASYVSGITELDEKIGSSVFDLPMLVTFRKRSKGLEISVMRNFKQYHTGIKIENLKNITLEAREQVFDQKEKSVVGRAVVGGLLLGPVGAIVGGMTGLGTKKTEIPIDLFLTINYSNERGEERIFLSTCTHRDRSEIYSFFSKEYKSMFQFK